MQLIDNMCHLEAADEGARDDPKHEGHAKASTIVLQIKARQEQEKKTYTPAAAVVTYFSRAETSLHSKRLPPS